MERILDLDDPETGRRLEATVLQVREEIRSLTEPIKRGSQLTAEDYMIRINAGPVEYNQQ